MKRSTVLLLYPDYVNNDGHETYMAYVQAPTRESAIVMAQHDALRACALNLDQADDFAVLAVFAGYVREVQS